MSGSRLHQSSSRLYWITLLAGLLIVPDVAAQPEWTVMLESSVHLNAVDFVDENFGFAGGYGVILKTTDGGQTWNNILPEYLFNSDQYAMSAVSADTVFTVGSPSSTIRHTFDGGETWGTIVMEREFGQFTWVTALKARSGGPMFAVGETAQKARIFRSVNGIDWFAMNHGVDNALFLDVAIVDASTIWVVGLDNVILKSENGGLTWQRRESPIEDGESLVEITKVHFLEDGMTGWIATGLFAGAPGSVPAIIFRTVDGGESWEEMSRIPSVDRPGITGIHFSSPETGWISYEKTTAFTADGGRTWDLTSPASLGFQTQIAGLDFAGEDFGWVVGGQGAPNGSGFILRTTNGSAVSTSLEAPDLISSLAVYPNPISGSAAEITFTVDQADQTVVEVFDVLGRRVETMMNEVTSPGPVRLTWRPNRLGAGIYLVSVTAGSHKQVVAAAIPE